MGVDSAFAFFEPDTAEALEIMHCITKMASSFQHNDICAPFVILTGYNILPCLLEAVKSNTAIQHLNNILVD